MLLQSEPVEVVVVNSGGGNPSEVLRAAGMDVKIINHKQRLFPGAVRNIGIQATQAPYVSFLAADCIAEPGWAKGRLKRHLAGVPAVSSAVTNQNPRNIWSWISYISLFARRMPNVSPDLAKHYGVSYDRTLFDRFGMFREDIMSGEDSDFNERLSGRVAIAWAPEVRSAHHNPTTFLSLLRDQYSRGGRMAKTLERLTGKSRRQLVALDAFTRTPSLVHLAWKATQDSERLYMVEAAILMMPATIAYALGALFSAKDKLELPQAVDLKPRILALLTFHNEMRYLPDYFRNVAPQVDGIIALNDGSTDGSGDFVGQQLSVLQLIQIPPRNPHVWDEPRNRRMVIEAAWKHDADWMVVVDADERLEHNFRQHAEAEIARADRDGYLAYRVRMLELWDHPDTYRADGIWGQKRPVRFFKARRDHEFDERPLHGYWAPLNSQYNGDYQHANLIIYHLRMICLSDRLERQAKYYQLDPNMEFQTIGYDYMTDITGLRLKKLTLYREYEPLVETECK
jgi:glycosyltransferase involved in cell wall biosynthesis